MGFLLEGDGRSGWDNVRPHWAAHRRGRVTGESRGSRRLSDLAG